MRILSFNANGLRSAARKDFFDWFAAQDIDVMCVQETKAQEHQFSRLPVTDGSLDKVAGILVVKDLLRFIGVQRSRASIN